MPITIEKPHTAHSMTLFSSRLTSRARRDIYLPQPDRWPRLPKLSELHFPAVNTLLDEDALQEEYHDLVDLEFAGRLTDADATRLRVVEELLNELDENDPNEQAIDKSFDETGKQIEALLRELQQQPLLP